MSASSTDATWLFVPDALRAAAGPESFFLFAPALSADEKSAGAAE